MSLGKTSEEKIEDRGLTRLLFNKKALLKIAVFIAVVLIGLNMRNILVIVTGSETPIAVIHGYSMYPLLREGDLVFAYKAPPDAIKVGDIIIYEGIDKRLIIHRVIEVKVINGKYYYVTKGDNNDIPDILQFTGPNRAGVPYDRVKGVVFSIDKTVFKIPYLGYLSIWYHGSSK